MTHTNRTLPQQSARSAVQRRRESNVSDAVTAAYIRDISERRRPSRVRSRPMKPCGAGAAA
jgi:hypothetical protein